MSPGWRLSLQAADNPGRRWGLPPLAKPGIGHYTDPSGVSVAVDIEPPGNFPTLSSRRVDGHHYHRRRTGRPALTPWSLAMAVANEVRPPSKKSASPEAKGQLERDRLRMMMLIRRFEEKTYQAFTEKGQKIGGFCHL